MSRLDDAQQLVRFGVDPHTVAAALDLSIRDVRTLSHTERGTKLSPEDQELANAMRNLAWKAYEEAMVTLSFGAPSDRQALIRAILGRTMGLVGMETTEKLDQMKNDFEQLLVSIRGSQEVLEEPPDAAIPGTATLAIDNPDQRPDD